MRKDVVPSGASAPCLIVVDALDGLFHLEKRSPTLHGTVPVRVAQACVPLLEGNAFGFQVTLTRRWQLVRGPLGWSLALPADEQAHLLERYARARERLIAAGYFRPGDPLHRFLEEKTLFGLPPGRLGRRLRLRLFTGLFVRPQAGVYLRLLPAKNRQSHSFVVEEEILIGEPAAEHPHSFVPLLLNLTLTPRAASARSLVVGGELACLAPLPSEVSFSAHPLSERPELGRAHAAFYAASYFERKTARATRRYRKEIDVRVSASQTATSACEIIVAGPTNFTIAGSEPLEKKTFARRSPKHVLYRNLLDFSFRYDGATVALAYDKEELQRKGRALWQGFRNLYGEDFVAAHEGALFYLSKYFTTHPPGEPHFFVKPWAFTRTPPGWSSLIEGSNGDGYEVMRGVIATDQFHATPAVFAISRADEEMVVPAETPLLRVFPLPRTLLHAGFRLQRLEDP